jgi:hypothetical protein
VKRAPLLALVLLAAVPLPGCLLVAGAAVGAGVVHATGDDTLEVVLHSGPEAVFAAARAEVAARGTVEREDAALREVDGSADGGSIRVKVLHEADGSARLRVGARKNAGISPDLETAEAVASAILRRVK